MVLDISKSELISYLKVFGTLPVSIIFMIVYTKMSVNRSKAFIFYSMHGFFMVMYAFIMIAYAFKDQIQPERGSLQEAYPSTLKPIATAFENWIIVLVFIFGEMYGSIILSLMFWGFANDICTVNESKRFYPLIGLTGNAALVVLGIILAALNNALKARKDLFLQISMGMVLLFLLII
jgi:AAA family ATP:ADP antiporter